MAVTPSYEHYEPRKAPILRLGSLEMSHVALFLSLRDIAYVHTIGCRQLWSLLSKAALEARFTPEIRSYTPVIPNNPFLLLSRLTRLLTVKLHRVWWTPSPHDPSPFRLLPRTVRHLEYEVATSRYSVPLNADECIPTWKVLLNLDLGAAFPELETLKVKVDLAFTGAIEESDVPSWVLTLPHTLTALSLANVGHYKSILRFVKGQIPPEEVQRPRNQNATTPPPASPRPYLPLPFPLLLGLELCHQNYRDPPPLTSLPPSLVHFKWSRHMEMNDNSMEVALAAEQKSRVVVTSSHFKLAEVSTKSTESLDSRLRSVFLSSSNRGNLDHIQSLRQVYSLYLPNATEQDAIPICKTLIILDVANLSISFTRDCHSNLMSRLHSSGVRLKEFRFNGLSLPRKLDEASRKLIISVLESVLVLTIQEISSFDLSFLPRQLQAFRAHTTNVDSVRWDDYDLSQLPPTLTELACPLVKIDLGDIPLLPRALLHLEFCPTNGMVIGTSNLTPQMRLDNLPYESLTPASNVLYGLPPKLRTLSVSGELEFDSTFGLFLPRSLQRINGGLDRTQHCINLRDAPKSIIHSIGAWLRIAEEPQDQKKLLKRAIHFFPPGCSCTLSFLEASILIRQEVNFNEIQTICPFTTMESRI